MSAAVGASMLLLCCSRAPRTSALLTSLSWKLAHSRAYTIRR